MPIMLIANKVEMISTRLSMVLTLLVVPIKPATKGGKVKQASQPITTTTAATLWYEYEASATSNPKTE
jgi:hypothetical protein